MEIILSPHFVGDDWVPGISDDFGLEKGHFNRINVELICEYEDESSKKAITKTFVSNEKCTSLL